MEKLDFLQTEDDYVAYLDIVDKMLDLGYFANILPTSYLRLEAALSYIKYYVLDQASEVKPDKIEIPKSAFDKIVSMAKTYDEFAGNKVNVKTGIESYVKMALSYIGMIYKRESREIAESDLKNLLAAIDAVDRKIDNN